MKRILILNFIILFAWTKFLFGKEKPNIIFIFIDDMGYGDLGCYGNKRYESPAIDKIASEGIRFSQFYVNSPICSPSRVAVTTGQYPSRWGITSFINDRKSNKERGMKDFLDLKAPTLARNLQESGYYTAHIGKWHMGGGRDIGDVPYITEYGFNESVTQFEGIGERYLATYETLGLKDRTRGLEKMSAALGKGEVHWIKREDFTKTYVGRAIQAINHAKEDGKPFYVNLWPDDVHAPHEPSARFRGNGGRDDLYKGTIKEMDVQLNVLFDFIRLDPALKNNTLIIIASDNGPAKGIGSAGNLKGHKGTLFEGGIREPLIVWGPGIISPELTGKTNTQTVLAGMDLAPSILRIAGGQKAKGIKYDGSDMSRILLGFEQVKRKKPIMWQRPSGVKNFDKNADNPDLAIRDGDYKLLINIDGTNPALYDVAKDESESRNLVNQYPDLANRLKKKALKWYKETGWAIPEEF
jgi:uncharacterized sulfatase